MKERCVRLRPGNNGPAQRFAAALKYSLAVRPLAYDLGDHGVIERRNRIARPNATIDAHTVKNRLFKGNQPPC